MAKIPIVWYLFVATMIYILFLKSCGRTKCPVGMSPTQVVKHDTIINEYHDTVPIYDPAPAFTVTQWDTVFIKPNHLDTAGIIADYMFKRAYSQIIPNKYGFVTIIDTLFQNKIESQKVIFDFKVPQVTLTNQIPVKNKVFFGVDLGSNGSFISVGPQFVLMNKKNQMYWLGASFTSQNNIYYHFGKAWLIHF